MAKINHAVSFLLYHRIEVDFPKSTFWAHLELLKHKKKIISYDEAIKTLSSRRVIPEDLYVLTFDDGYQDLYTVGFPVLKNLNLPAIVFIPTGFIENSGPINNLPKSIPLSWKMLKEMSESGLLTIGSHTHMHLELPKETKDTIIAELKRPIDILRENLGKEVKHFAYPRAIWDKKVELLVKRFYETAALVGLKRMTTKNFNPYRIIRRPVIIKVFR